MQLNFQPSDRALVAASRGPAWDLMQKVAQMPRYDPNTQPNGIINLSGALNALMLDWMNDFARNLNPLPIGQTLSYGPISGSQALLSATSNFFNRFFKPSSPITPDQILASNGVTSLIDLVTWTLCDDGDAVLYPTPNFYMLNYDLSARTGLISVPVSTWGIDDQFSDAGLADLIHAFETAAVDVERTRGSRCRVLFLCNPANPQGRCYSRNTLLGLAKWCAKREMHLVVDEIYALSVFDNGIASMDTFTSVLSLPCEGALRDNIHCLYGMSKDFALGGLRMAFYVTRNSAVRNAMSKVSWFNWVTAFSDQFVTRFFEQLHLVEDYVAIYQERLRCAYSETVHALDMYQIPYAPSNAGLFLFIDLSRWIRYFSQNSGTLEDTEQVVTNSLTPELQLCHWLIRHGVFLNPGQFAESARPGYFRLVFTEYPHANALAIKRISNALSLLGSNP
ncbi:hypothetical protein ACHAPJ_008946 [Fusarium lateritium]